VVMWILASLVNSDKARIALGVSKESDSAALISA